MRTITRLVGPLASAAFLLALLASCGSDTPSQGLPTPTPPPDLAIPEPDAEVVVTVTGDEIPSDAATRDHHVCQEFDRIIELHVGDAGSGFVADDLQTLIDLAERLPDERANRTLHTMVTDLAAAVGDGEPIEPAREVRRLAIECRIEYAP